MPPIRPLPPDVASRIAAGEVIERPASVLKELLENALDAGASKIAVEILGAGRSLIRVSDDGCGMGPADCRSAFKRHTTSKISKFSDIDSLSTFGFRGEALYSIAAVSKITLASCPRGTRKGWQVNLRGGRLVSEREAPPAEGTFIEVRDLFFNTPARAKFLKSDASEKSHLVRIVEEAALANPGIAFTYTSEGRTSLRFGANKASSKNASLRARVAEVLGESRGRDLLLAERSSGGISVTAFLSPAENLQSTRTLQFCLVNRRPVVNRTVQQAMYRAYEPFRPKNRHPAAVIFLSLPPDHVDVNVHPTKREVRFRDDAPIFETVTRALSKALLRAKGIPTLEDRFVHNMARGGEPVSPVLSGQRLAEAESPYAAGITRTIPGVESPQPERPWFSESLRYLGQVERSYLLFEESGGLLIIDQHAGQERVLFERYLNGIQSGKIPVQELMLPLSIELPASAIQGILAKKSRLRRIGFEVEAFGKTSLHVTSVPALFARARDIQDMIHSLLDGLTAPGSAAADIRYDATATIACKAAIKAHDSLSPAEAVRLVEDLRKCENATCCPHGRPTMLSFNRDELARRFKRPGAPPL